MIRKLLGLTAVATVLATMLGAPAFAAPGNITLASTDDAGTNGNGDSYYPSLSADALLHSIMFFAMVGNSSGEMRGTLSSLVSVATAP